MENGGAKFLALAGGSPQTAGDADRALIGVSSLFRQVISIIDAVASNDCVVLLEGESGTGKELLARRIHLVSARRTGPFVPVSCPSVSESLFESQFYGHVRGAFTGAAADTLGIVRAAQHGTLFLDEVGELPLHLQPKLLRLLQEREVVPVGAAAPVPVNARFVAATNRSLAKSVEQGAFRSDLYHRLNVVRIEIPPLRSRPEDIDCLLDHYLDYYAQRYDMPQKHLGASVRQSLRQYSWPGNVRELCCYVERLYAANMPATAPAVASWEDSYSYRAEPVVHAGSARNCQSSTAVSLAEAEASAIQQALEVTGHNRSAAAKLLDIHRSTLIRKMRLHGMGGS